MAQAKIDPLTLNVNTFQADPLLRDIAGQMPRAAQAQFSLLGQYAGSHEADELARLANEIKPQLRTSDTFGDQLNQVEYHPAYHALMRKGVQVGLHSSLWQEQPDKTLRSIAFASRYLSDTEKRSAINELELLAVVWGLEHFRLCLRQTE